MSRPAAGAMSAPGVPAFHGFCKLATELQLKIWTYAVPDPRILRVKICASDTPYDETFHARDPAHYFEALYQAASTFELDTKSLPCGLLGACRSSRDVMLKIYKSVLPLAGDRILRFDGNYDTILLHHHDRSLQLIPGQRREGQTALLDAPNCRAIFRSIKNLALSLDSLSERTIMSHRFWRDSDAIWILSKFTSLEKLFLFREGKARSAAIGEDPAELSMRTIEESTASLCETLEQFKDITAQKKAVETATPREMLRYIKVDNVRVSVVHMVSTAPEFDAAYSPWVAEKRGQI